jgi:hypothetical protein
LHGNQNPKPFITQFDYRYIPVKQVCGYGICILIGSGSGSRRTKMTNKNLKILFFEVLDVLFGGLKASPLAWTTFKKAKGQVNCNF